MSKMKKTYYLKLKDMLITRCCVPRTFLVQTVDGRFSYSSGVLMKYCIQPLDLRVLYNIAVNMDRNTMRDVLLISLAFTLHLPHQHLEEPERGGCLLEQKC